MIWRRGGEVRVPRSAMGFTSATPPNFWAPLTRQTCPGLVSLVYVFPFFHGLLSAFTLSPIPPRDHVHSPYPLPLVLISMSMLCEDVSKPSSRNSFPKSLIGTSCRPALSRVP